MKENNDKKQNSNQDSNRYGQLLNQAETLPFFSQEEAEQEFYETLYKLEKENPHKANELYRILGNHDGKSGKKKNS